MVLESQGMRSENDLSEKASILYNRAFAEFRKLACPTGILMDISKEDFRTVFEGEGNNNADAPLAKVFPEADCLALFTFTLGQKISERIENLFNDNEPALASIIDAVASCGAYNASLLAEKERNRTEGYENSKTLLYSPGYCGWHITAQKKIFNVLKPEEIGITLNESCLMIPLKSISGVLITGNKEIHRFSPGFDFCEGCKNRSCIERMN